MSITRRPPRRALAGAAVAVLVGIVVWQAARVVGVPGGSDSGASASSAIGLGSTSPEESGASAPGSGADATASPSVAVASASASTNPTARPTRTDDSWQADPAFVAAKNEGRVAIDSNGRVVILDRAPPTFDYPAAVALDTRWSGLIQEPPWKGTDDHGTAYTDRNYALLCGPGTATVVLYYWPATRKAVTTKSGTFVEPVNLGASRYARTYWKAQDAAGYGRGMILYLAEVEWPAPDKGLSWWPRAGLLNWATHPPETDVDNLVDAINWEASGGTRLDYFYTIVPASQLTAAALRDHIRADLGMGVPVVIAARSSDGTNRLPFWRARSRRTAVNHFVTVVGYDDNAGTYQVMDTCGLLCNDRNLRAGVGSVRQSALFSLIQAESDDDGIMW